MLSFYAIGQPIFSTSQKALLPTSSVRNQFVCSPGSVVHTENKIWNQVLCIVDTLEMSWKQGETDILLWRGEGETGHYLKENLFFFKEGCI